MPPARTAFPEDRAIIHNRVQAIVEGIAATYGVTVDFIWEDSAPAVINDPRWLALVAFTAESLGLTVTGPNATLGGEDFSYYLDRAPGAFFRIGVGNKGRAMHGPTFYVKLDALADGADLLATSVVNTLAALGSD